MRGFPQPQQKPAIEDPAEQVQRDHIFLLVSYVRIVSLYAFHSVPRFTLTTPLNEYVVCVRDVFKVKPNVHAGMHRKPLEPYHPNAHRNRLTSPSVVMPYKNSSQIVIGDRR